MTDPGPGDANFATAVYRRGAMALQAVRETIGDGPFFELLKKWPAGKKFGNATAAEFEAMAEQVSHQDLDALFDTCLPQSCTCAEVTARRAGRAPPAARRAVPTTPRSRCAAT
ncbi:aminopeptidase N [Actinophytocola algeriensis]|uniref:Aminopeptidase N n=1 Tax=Actinophytocola algeriensis TaxID=1768010 RepID=A0A7W7VIW2_9PSEU|nr:aminopeptidase N [Actinophytocola algeriensis]MBE1477645.1 aminopeptidase N [Actinophytocola algeriensis]